MIGESDIPVESYFRYPSQYDNTKPSAIERYVHPKLYPPDFTPLFHRPMEQGVAIELQELVLQAVANWPQADVRALVSDRANVHPSDVSNAFNALLQRGVLEISEPGFQFFYPTQATDNTEQIL